MKTDAFTDALIKKLDGFRIDGCVSKLLAEGMSDFIYSGWLSNNGIYGAAKDFPDEFDPELLRIIHEERKGREKLEFQRAMSMVIIRKVLEEGLMMINYDGPELTTEKEFASWPLSVDGSVQKVYDLWGEAFARSETDIDQYLFALWNTDSGNEMGKKALRKIWRGYIAVAEKAIELEPDVIKHYVNYGHEYLRSADHEWDPIKEAKHRKKIREIAETIRKLAPDDTRHNKHDRAAAYHFFSRIEPDEEKAREYDNKAHTISGEGHLVDAEDKEESQRPRDAKMFDAYNALLEKEENRIDDLVKAMEIDSRTAKEWKEGMSNLKNKMELLQKYWGDT
ncbi:MAG: hypothetical protein LBL04_10300 [Bacteroidales bacterium]|jgi:hypothetical protein|nr:hypothetical protein [Bacteroidales bacterium]